MKKCNNCGMLVKDQADFCTSCGSSDFAAPAENIAQPVQPLASQDYQPSSIPVNPAQNVDSDGGSAHGNVLAGIVGAFLFSIIGGLLYFVIYQAGVIAGICGLVMLVLANFGYGLFAKPKRKNSWVCLTVALVATAIMIFVAEYVCVSYEIFKVFEVQGITIFDAVRATPEFLAEPEIGGAFAKDLVVAYLFGLLASLGSISGLVKSNKKKK